MLAVATNDLHRLMFRPVGGKEQGGWWWSYTTGPVWYLYYAFVILCIISGVVLLAVRDRREKSRRRTLPSVLLLFLMLAMMTVFDRFELYSPWMFPEIAVFCMLGIFESCVRNRLIPSNENYGPFFEQVSFPALITDRDLKPVFRTASGGSIPTDRLADALAAPCELESGRVLHGRKLSAGYVFFTSDESGVQTNVERKTDRSFSYAELRALYDTFEILIEALPADATALSVTLGDGSMRLLTDCRKFDVPRGTPAAVAALTEDDQLYLTVTAAEGGAL